MRRNYQSETDKIISSLGEDCPTLLLQCCCGPCSSYVLEYLTEFFKVTVLFYNPNIQPQEEYLKRLSWLRRVTEKYNGRVMTLECDYEGERFDAAAKGLEREFEGGARCTKCFELRLSQTAKFAKQQGFDYFCTTLSVSPHKDQERINQIGFQLQNELGVLWLPSDFKKREGYKRSTELSKEYGLYRQEYCGCLFSRQEITE